MMRLSGRSLNQETLLTIIAIRQLLLLWLSQATDGDNCYAYDDYDNHGDT